MPDFPISAIGEKPEYGFRNRCRSPPLGFGGTNKGRERGRRADSSVNGEMRGEGGWEKRCAGGSYNPCVFT